MGRSRCTCVHTFEGQKTALVTVPLAFIGDNIRYRPGTHWAGWTSWSENPCDLLVSLLSANSVLESHYSIHFTFLLLKFQLRGESQSVYFGGNELPATHSLIPWYPFEHHLLMKGTLLSSVVGTATTSNSLQALLTSQEPWKGREHPGWFGKAHSNYVSFKLKGFLCCKVERA